MRIFNAQVMDVHLEGSGIQQMSNGPWACLLARAESLNVTCIVDHVGGTLPTLTLGLQSSPTGGTDYWETSSVLMNASALVGGTNLLTASYATTDPNNPPTKHLFLIATLGGTANPTAHVRVWACGRGPQQIEQAPATGSSFAAQYAAAKMLDDENRLPLRKRTLKQGASLFYPPEVFSPLLKWER